MYYSCLIFHDGTLTALSYTHYKNNYIYRTRLWYPYFTAPDLVEYLDVSRRTAYKVVDDLGADGLIEEVTGKERGTEYKAVEVFDILE